VVHFRWLEGERDPHQENSSTFKGIKLLLKPCKEAEHLFADATLIVPLLAIERGLFGELTLDDLITHKDFVIRQDKKVAKQAVFVALKGPNNTALSLSHPLNAGKFNPPLQSSAAETGINNKGVTMYGFRREFITTAGRNPSTDEAMVLANHRTPQYEMNRRYDFGSVDLNITDVSLNEGQDISDQARQRHLNRQTIQSAAIHATGMIPDEDIDRFVVSMMPNNETIQQWEESFMTILVKLRGRHFSEDDPAIDSIPATLRGLAALASAVGRANTLEPSAEKSFARA